MTKIIHLSEATYNKLRQTVTGRIDHFVNRAINKAIKEEIIDKSYEKLEKKHLEKQLKTDYQRIARNENIQKELDAMSKMSLEDIYGKRKRK